jgi:hypothetical protein
MNKVLSKMLDRLLAGLMSGPNMNCRPHNSRQRIDLTQLTRLADLSPEQTLKNLLGPDKCATTTARIKMPRKTTGEEKSPADKSPDEKAWLDQSNLLNKLRVIADEARTYENDTGVHALSIGFPILSLPPGSFAGGARNSTKRILAPIAFIPVTLSLKRGATPSIELSCRGEGADRVLPNKALQSWIEQQTGKPAADMFEDEEGIDPWREISELVKHVADAMHLQSPEAIKPASFSGHPEGALDESTDDEKPADFNAPSESPVENPLPIQPPAWNLLAAPRSDDDAEQPAILLSAVLGLFPTSHQGLLRDTRAMLSEDKIPEGPIQNFLTSGIDFDQPMTAPAPTTASPSARDITAERLAAAADPCQARAVSLAREATGLVVHGPPGTGKSQTITNIIADHLARGQRVLLVCDKRTALDVVADRLEHMGLRSLCGIVHDPQRDQRDLYRSVHQQLDELPEAKVYPRAAASLETIDAELQQLHGELTGFHNALMKPTGDGGPSFHELMGEWMCFKGDSSVMLDDAIITEISVEDLHAQRANLTELLGRAVKADYFKNPWTKCAGISLGDFLSRPMESLRTAMERIVAAADSADATADERIPVFTGSVPVIDQARARMELAEILTELLPSVVQAKQAAWIDQRLETIREWREKFKHLRNLLASLRSTSLDSALANQIHWPGETSVELSDKMALQRYLDVSKKWWGIFAFVTKSNAAAVLKKYSLPLNPENAERISKFIGAAAVRFPLVRFCALTLGAQPAAMPDAEIENFFTVADQWFQLLERIATDESLAELRPLLAKALAPGVTHSISQDMTEDQTRFSDGPEGRAVDGVDSTENTALRAVAKQGAADSVGDFVKGLRLSTPRADAIVRMEEALVASRLFDSKWLKEFASALRNGKFARETTVALAERLDQLEGVLRVRAGRAAVPATMAKAVDQMLSQNTNGLGAMNALQQKVLTAEITRRLRENPTLQSIDAHRVEVAFDRCRQLDAEKKNLVRDSIANLWVGKQKQRLLNSTGSRLNSVGADLRRRLTSRGERAMRLRQVIAIGDSISGGDPLFDLCPVWMASPETVAQIFPRKAMFDVIIFDEASQCRLEEALPVLTRGKRVVIAGDPNQLPPTRFFESGLVQSQQEDPETDQELFETQQGEVEDLLAAALNLAIQQCYLDVHYRSRNADLIEFSNRNFYASRLQAIPAHPSNRSKFSPLTLYRVDGTYSKRQNEAEADRVVAIVSDLLKRAEPPSIGVACLNLPQRDLITEKLDDLAAEDREFAKRLAAARLRKGAGSFEGLFVKNLENVQGDERDHIIISTTYGPDDQGKFYRRFGPLGMAGGGRRLNVLVTRARCEVHLVTSIPAEAYRSLPPIPEGQTATGAWLLFAYLKYSEELLGLYSTADQSSADGANVQRSTLNVQHPGETPPVVNVLPSKTPSLFAEKFAGVLAKQNKIGSDVHWGNEGFCVDLALHDPVRPGEITIGILCDGCRYQAADDAVEWDIFKTGILAGQGWKLQRVWTPHYFRDPAIVLSEGAADSKGLAGKG